VPAEDEFREFVIARSPALLRAAWLLTGNEASAHDLVQATLLKSWTRWARVSSADSPEAYVRKVMMTTFLTWRRRRWHGELAVPVVPEVATSADEINRADVRAAVTAALGALPPRQRAVVVLRYFADQTEAQAAAALGCSIGTVKSQTARALTRLRTSPALAGVLSEEVAR
jgi:RNA polymerase sigma-70 factor (sigma-E family)